MFVYRGCGPLSNVRLWLWYDSEGYAKGHSVIFHCQSLLTPASGSPDLSHVISTLVLSLQLTQWHGMR